MKAGAHRSSNVSLIQANSPPPPHPPRVKVPASHHRFFPSLLPATFTLGHFLLERWDWPIGTSSSLSLPYSLCTSAAPSSSSELPLIPNVGEARRFVIMKFNAVAAAVSAAMLAGMARADDAVEESSVAPELPTFTVSSPILVLATATWPRHR